MPDDVLDVRGGAGGLAADLAAMRSAAGVLARVAADLGVLAANVGVLVVDPALLATARVDPGGFARVQAALLPLASGPAGLGACAARVGTLGLRVATAAGLYEQTERAVTALAAAGRVSAARGLGVAARGSAPLLLAGAAVAGASWSGTRAGQLVWAEAHLVVADLAAGRFRWWSVDDVFTRVGDGATRVRAGHGLVLRADASAAGRTAVGWLAAEPGAAEAVVGGAPDFLAGLTHPLVLPGSLQHDGDDLAWPPESVAELAALVTGLGAVSPVFAERPVDVRPVTEPPAVPVEATAGGVLGALQRLAPYTASAPPQAVPRRSRHRAWAGDQQVGRVRVERIASDDGVRWSVYVPPTQSWAVTGGPVAFDGSSNLRSVGGRGTTAATAVTQALRQAGARCGEPVLLAGFSQGGLTAMQLAGDPQFTDEFDVSAVLTAGSPVAGFDVGAGVQVLSLEHEQDLVTVLDDGRNPAPPSWATVRRDLSVGTPQDPAAGAAFVAELKVAPLAAHRLDHYLDTAELVDASTDDSLVAWRAAAAPFLDVRAADVLVTEYQVTPVDP